MNRKLWDLYAPIYKRAMKADQHIYEFMYKRIPDVIRDSEFLEQSGWNVTFSKEMSARIAMVYAECTRGKKTENVELL